MKLNEIPTAREARAQADQKHNERLERENGRVLEMLAQAIAAGHCEVNIPYPISVGLRVELEGKGYKIGQPYQSDYNETSVKVQW